MGGVMLTSPVVHLTNNITVTTSAGNITYKLTCICITYKYKLLVTIIVHH